MRVKSEHWRNPDREAIVLKVYEHLLKDQWMPQKPSIEQIRNVISSFEKLIDIYALADWDVNYVIRINKVGSFRRITHNKAAIHKWGKEMKFLGSEMNRRRHNRGKQKAMFIQSINEFFKSL